MQWKKGDKNKGDDPKSKDKVINTGDTAGAHVGDTTTTEESTIPIGGASIGAHVLETNEQPSRPSRTVEKSLDTLCMIMIFWAALIPVTCLLTQ